MKNCLAVVLAGGKGSRNQLIQGSTHLWIHCSVTLLFDQQLPDLVTWHWTVEMITLGNPASHSTQQLTLFRRFHTLSNNRQLKFIPEHQYGFENRL